MQLRNVTGCVLVQLGILAACVWMRNVTFTNRLETQRPHVQLSCGNLLKAQVDMLRTSV